MTPEQLDQLYRQFAHIHPEMVKKGTTYEDPDFEDYTKRVEAESDGVIYGDTRVVEFGSEAVEIAPAGQRSSSPYDPDDWEEIA